MAMWVWHYCLQMLCGFVYSSLQRITLQDMDFVVIAYVAITYNNTENIYENQML